MLRVSQRLNSDRACHWTVRAGKRIFIYTYNDILNNAEAINVEVMMRMLKILWKETERKRVVEN